MLDDKRSCHFFLRKSADIEMNSYALLTLVMRSDVENALPVLKWLISQQNQNGGFSSTQDTVIGVQALGALAARISTNTIGLDVKFNFRDEEESLDRKSVV